MRQVYAAPGLRPHGHRTKKRELRPVSNCGLGLLLRGEGRRSEVCESVLICTIAGEAPPPVSKFSSVDRAEGILPPRHVLRQPGFHKITSSFWDLNFSKASGLNVYGIKIFLDQKSFI